MPIPATVPGSMPLEPPDGIDVAAEVWEAVVLAVAIGADGVDRPVEGVGAEVAWIGGALVRVDVVKPAAE